MNKIFDSRFYFFYCLLLAAPSLLLGINVEVFIYDFCLSAISLILLSKLNTKKLYFNKNYKSTTETFFLWGNFFKSESNRDKVEDIFKKLELSKRIKRYLSSAFIFVVGLSICLTLLDAKYLYISLVSSLLVLTTFWRHLYFVFLLKLLIVTVILVTQGLIIKEVILGELLMLFISLNLFAKENKKKDESFFQFKDLWRFFFIAALVTIIIPKSEKEIEKEQKRIVKTIKIKRANLNLNMNKIQKKLGGQTQDIESQVESMIAQIDTMENLLQNFPDVGFEFKESLNQTKIELYGMKEDLNLKGASQKLSTGAVKRLLQRMKKIKGRSFLDIKNHGQGELVNHKLKAAGGTFFENFEGGSDELIESLKEIERTTVEKQSLNDDLQNLIKPKTKDNSRFSFFNNPKVQGFLLIVAFFLIISFIRSRMRRSTSRILNKEQKKSVLEKMKYLRSLKLTPNEEIVQVYNVWREKVKESHFKNAEAPPPMQLSNFFYKNNQRRHKPINLISTLFCDCYYGDLEATGQELKKFRQNFLTILSY